MLNRKNRFFNNYKRHAYKADDKVKLDAFRIERQQAVEAAKLSYQDMACLIFKLEQNGISGNLLKLLQNYLRSRKQRVVQNGSHSNYSSIETGVPQGSVLGPLLFLVSCLHQ